MVDAVNIDRTSEPTSLRSTPESAPGELRGLIDSLDGTNQESSAPVGRRISAPVGRVADQDARLEEIEEMISNPDVPIADIVRFIALQIARMMHQMSSPDPVMGAGWSKRNLLEQMKVWRELRRTLVESAALSHKEVLDLEGPKFMFVFNTLLALFAEALDDARVDDELHRLIMNSFRDRMVTKDEWIHAEVKKI
jgi:hypothetical protein